MKKTDLVTVPTFVFDQGELGDENYERPVIVSFYNGSICLSQSGGYDAREEIILSPAYVSELFKTILKPFINTPSNENNSSLALLLGSDFCNTVLNLVNR